MINEFPLKSSNFSNYSNKNLEIVSQPQTKDVSASDEQHLSNDLSSNKEVFSSVNTQATQSHEFEPNNLSFGNKSKVNNTNNTSLDNESLSLNAFNVDTDSEPVRLGSNINSNTDISSKYSNQLINLSIEFQDSLAKVLSNDELNEFNAIVDKYKDSTEIPNPEEIAKIKNILNKLKNSDNISAEAKSKLTEYENSFNSIEGNNLQQGIDQSKAQLNTSLSNLSQILSHRLPDGPILNHINHIVSNYQKALADGDERAIAMYSTFLDKVNVALSNPKCNGRDISRIMNEYNRVNRLVDGNGNAAEADRELMRFIGRPRFNNLRLMVENNRNRRRERNSEPEGRMNALSQRTSISPTDSAPNGSVTAALRLDRKSNPPMPQIEQKIIDKISTLTNQEVRKEIESCPGLLNAMKQVTNDSEKYIEAEVKMVNFVNQTDTYTSNSSPEKILNEMINQSIENAQNLEAQFVDSMDVDSASIVPLLEKFREIISRLDIDTRDNIRKSLEATGIANSFSTQKRDMELRWASLDKLKQELNIIFEELKQKQIA